MATITKLAPDNHPWLYDASLRVLFAIIKKSGGEARVVGGAVRDALLGRSVGDVDLAVNLKPDDVIRILADAGIKTVPTGIDHGTITAVINGTGYEITTLRQDVQTYGRHAKVEFTDDWQADAARRDFTINAIYVDDEGNLYDYFNGQKDLANGHVRFIGDAATRIQEDVLRILRFFRFTAWFAKGVPDSNGLSASAALAHMIPTLSVERVWNEIKKLLTAKDPSHVWQLMLENKILNALLPESTNTSRLKGLVEAENNYRISPNPLIRLAALLPDDVGLMAMISLRLKLSKREATKLTTLASLPSLLHDQIDPVSLRRTLYNYDADNVGDGLSLYGASHPATDMTGAMAIVADWQKPHFPLQGNDLIKLGVPAGPKMGTILRAVEEWWIAKDFHPTHAQCLAEAKKQI